MSEVVFNIEDINNFTVVKIQGDLDAANVNKLADELDRLVGESRYNVIIDMSGVGHLNSRAFGILVHRYKVFKDHGGDIKLCGLDEHNMMIFEILGGTQIFSIYNTLDEVLNR